MTMLADRLLGRSFAGDVCLPGQVILTGAGWVDGLPVESGVAIVPSRPSKPARVQSGVSEHRINVLETPDSMDGLAIDELATSINSSMGTWFGLALEVPVVAVGLDKKARLLEADRQIEHQLPHLAAVAYRPKTRLFETRELTPIGRVRRPARGAEARLAAHSEDWYRRRFRSVEPKRLMSRRLHLDLDLYENRIAVTLLDPEVPRYLGQRLHDLQRLHDTYEEALRALDEGTFWRRNRIYGLWLGEFEDASAVSDAHHRTREVSQHLTELLQRTRQLYGSPLALELRGKSPDGRSLRLTNVLVNDQHYRRVAELWKALVESRTEQETAADRLERLLRRHHAMTGYVAGMIARILTAMGYEPNSDAVTGPAQPDIELSGAWGSAVFSWNEHDTLRVGHPTKMTHIIPLAADLAALAEVRGPESLAAVHESCENAVVVYLGASASRSSSEPPWTTVERSASPGGLREGSLIAVTPVEPTSIERLGRTVFRAVLEPALRAFPPEVRIDDDPVPPRLRDVLRDLSFLHVEGSVVAMTRPLQYEDRKRLQRSLDVVEDAARGPGWQREHHRFLKPLQSSVLVASAELERLLNCPVCRAQNHANAWAQRSEKTFEVHCVGCGSGWGLHSCGNCGDRFPVLGQPHLDQDLHVTGRGWVERIVGRDCLSTPCWARIPGQRTFICPTCQECGASGSQAAASCLRCRRDA
jgi:hypothetical protein